MQIAFSVTVSIFPKCQVTVHGHSQPIWKHLGQFVTSQCNRLIKVVEKTQIGNVCVWAVVHVQASYGAADAVCIPAACEKYILDSCQ